MRDNDGGTQCEANFVSPECCAVGMSSGIACSSDARGNGILTVSNISKAIMPLRARERRAGFHGGIVAIALPESSSIGNRNFGDICGVRKRASYTARYRSVVVIMLWASTGEHRAWSRAHSSCDGNHLARRVELAHIFDVLFPQRK